MKAWLLQRLSNLFLGDYLGSIVRHAMTAVGGFLIAKGLATPDAVNGAMPELVELVIGIITAAVGQGLSFANKKI
jgi:hypothetical protein